ncbi:hypothetical protein L3Q67_45065 (plasmid) [Saccharothrix sp. AJ9571]|nr:hypothetical protein L3Q67_45065 [Saccharothrix sp. AJ9571]
MITRPVPPRIDLFERVAAQLWPVAIAALLLAGGTFLTAWCWVPLLLCLIAAAVRGQEIWDHLTDNEDEDEVGQLRLVQWQVIPAALAILLIGLAAVASAAEFLKAVLAPAVAALNLPGIAAPVAAALRGWFAETTTGLPVTADQLLTLWAVALGAMIIGGMFGFRGAQLGYGLLAGATAAMVWQGAPSADQRPALLLAVLCAFAVLAIPVLRRPMGSRG